MWQALLCPHEVAVGPCSTANLHHSGVTAAPLRQLKGGHGDTILNTSFVRHLDNYQDFKGDS